MYECSAEKDKISQQNTYFYSKSFCKEDAYILKSIKQIFPKVIFVIFGCGNEETYYKHKTYFKKSEISC